MDSQTLLTCLIAVTLLTLTPGLDTFLIIRNSVRGGRLDGTVSSLGICSGLLVHACISALGVSVILLHTVWAFTSLKILGACYLLWLGIISITKVCRNSVQPLVIDSGTDLGRSEISLARSFREGFLSNLLNPKAVLFYMAFLPQFINPEQNAFVQSLIVAGLHAFVAMIWLSCLSIMVEQAKTWLTNRKVDRVLNGALGGVMVFFGFRLLLDD